MIDRTNDHNKPKLGWISLWVSILGLVLPIGFTTFAVEFRMWDCGEAHNRGKGRAGISGSLMDLVVALIFSFFAGLQHVRFS